MKNKKTIFHPIKLIGALVFLMAFTLNIQTSLNGEWELVNVGFAQGTTAHTCAEGETPVVRTVNNYNLIINPAMNNTTMVDATDCIPKSCYLYTTNGTCTYFECIPKGGSSGN